MKWYSTTFATKRVRVSFRMKYFFWAKHIAVLMKKAHHMLKSNTSGTYTLKGEAAFHPKLCYGLWQKHAVASYEPWNL